MRIEYKYIFEMRKARKYIIYKRFNYKLSTDLESSLIKKLCIG